MMNRRLLRRGTIDHYRDAALYDYEYRNRREDVAFYRELAEESGGPVLELGCGSGRVAAPIARAGCRVVGIDLSAEMLARARERSARLPRACRGNLQLVRADLSRFELGCRFPLISAPFNTLQHLYDAGLLLSLFRRVRRHLEAGGRFVFDVLLPDVDWLARNSDRRWARRTFTHPTSGRRLVHTISQQYDPVSQVSFVRIYYDPPEGERGSTRVIHLAHRQYFPQELRLLIKLGGLRIDRCYGDFARGKLDAESESQVYVCTEAVSPSS